MKSVRTVALLTDFGTDDAFVASMKGAILSIAPDVRIIDITHAIQPQNIVQGSYLLWSAYKYFPKGTIFVSVVDPEVGTTRKILCIEGNGYTFLAPDNGLLQYVMAEIKIKNIVAVIENNYCHSTVSSTFHGRDIFAPVAAYLCNGVPIKKFGPKVRPQYGAVSFVTLGGKSADYHGTILHIDHFGNIVTNYILSPSLNNYRLKIGRRVVTALHPTYNTAPPNVPFLIRGSSGLLEVGIKNKSAANYLQAKLNQPITMTVL